MGGSGRLTIMFSDLKAAARRTLSSMATIDESLDRKERTDDDFRKLNPDAPGTTSRVLTADIRANNLRMREAYRNAQISDKQIEADMESEETQEMLKLVSKSREELLKLFPRDAPNLLDYDEQLDKPNENQDVRKLEDKLHDLAELIEVRTNELATLKKLASEDVTELANAALSKNEDITSKHATNLQQGREIQSRISEGVSRQEALLVEIMKPRSVWIH